MVVIVHSFILPFTQHNGMSRPKTTVESVSFRLRRVQNVGVCVDKGKVHPRTGHEGLKGERGIALLFL